MDVNSIKLRFGIIGNSALLNRAIDIACQVAHTDLTVLINGESGTGKEVFPKIIHQFSSRKHGTYIPVNCGAIPEGTIDSELFGHEKGSFTGAHEARKGYFEVANGGTIFLDEVAELPLSTQVRLLRVLESGEFMKVGSSTNQKTNVRVVAATNVDIPEAIRNGKFREDLYYRLNTVPIIVPPLRERREDIILLFRKFASDFAEKYRMPALQIDSEAQEILINYRWPGNIRQLKNLTEQISIIENSRIITAELLQRYLPKERNNDLPILFKGEHTSSDFSEREILYKVLFEMRKDITDLKKLVVEIMKNSESDNNLSEDNNNTIKRFYSDFHPIINSDKIKFHKPSEDDNITETVDDTADYIEENMSLDKKEKEMIIKALEKYKGKRKYAANELGISERTLYRKIKEYDI